MPRSLLDVILWKVPTARVAVSDDQVTAWGGPGAQPDAATLGQWVTEYDAGGVGAAATRTAQFTATSRQKDILATIALIVRARGIPAWNALSTSAKVAATQAEADVWIGIRQFLEDNLPPTP